MNKRVIAFLSILSLFLTLPLIPVNAAAKAGGACTKAGITSVVSSKTYTCVKSGKKLVWNKGVIKSTKTILVAPTSFSNLYENRNGISFAAWKSTADSITAGKSNVSNLKIYIGPNTTAPKYKTPEIAIGLVSQAFSKYKTPENVHVIQYSVADIQWAEEKVKSLIDTASYNELNRNENGRLVDSNCGKTDCFGAKQVSTRSGIAFVLQGVPTGTNNDPLLAARLELGQLDAHEFTHAMQRATIIGLQTKEWQNNWIIEGAAELSQNLVMSYKSYEEYMKWRKLDSQDFYGKNTKITTTFMTTYLSTTSAEECRNNNEPCYKYNLGSRIMEIFVALKGPGVMLDLFREYAVQGFEPAFQSIFGISWGEASPIINKTIVELFQSGE
jgi:hypothetical protein